MAVEWQAIINSTVVWIIICGVLIFLLRRFLVKKSYNLKVRWLWFLISGFIFLLIEENINAPPSGPSFFPYTMPPLILSILILLAVIKMFRIKSQALAVLIYGFLGWFMEFFIFYNPDLWATFWGYLAISVFAFLTYAVIIIIPVTLLQRSNRK